MDPNLSPRPDMSKYTEVDLKPRVVFKIKMAPCIASTICCLFVPFPCYDKPQQKIAFELTKLLLVTLFLDPKANMELSPHMQMIFTFASAPRST